MAAQERALLRPGEVIGECWRTALASEAAELLPCIQLFIIATSPAVSSLQWEWEF